MIYLEVGNRECGNKFPGEFTPTPNVVGLTKLLGGNLE
jgi:hypothetical protein